MNDNPNLHSQVALVTGASRGVGKGIAEALAAAGATVYATGRTIRSEAMAVPCKTIPCNHTDDAQVNMVFERIYAEQNHLDILVNNVWGGYEQMFQGEDFTWTQPCWEQPVALWDDMFAAGVRAHYVAACAAARQMTQQGSGLIVNISFWAAQKYIANTAYGVAKAATDKMATDLAQELKPHNIAVFSLYPGLVRTEKVMEAAEHLDLSNSESPQFSGRAIAALATDPNIMNESGAVLIAAECALKYGFTDIDGTQPRPLTLDEV
ncbi:MAG: SDR family NAD(P)-dependent oxidoreductase [Pseudomonadota bacterium]